VADFSLIAGVIYLCGFFYQQFYSQPFTISLTLYMMIAGLFLTIAFVFLNAAILSGKGALAISITQTQSFFWLLLEILISLRVPHAYEIVAMGFGITGACIIAKK
jgi:drug/metabolite transporter (DMT)-like permease